MALEEALHLRTDGTVLMDDVHIADRKYEGLELAGPSAATELAVESSSNPMDGRSTPPIHAAY